MDEKDYDNEYNNMLLDYVEKYDGQVILFDDGLARYIKRSRPRIAIVASLNKAMCNLQDSRESESDYYRDLFRLYDEVVVRSEYVLRDGWLDDLRDRRDSVEIIVNQFCVPDCKHASVISASSRSGVIEVVVARGALAIIWKPHPASRVVFPRIFSFPIGGFLNYALPALRI